MQEDVVLFNEAQAAANEPTLAVGIGIHTGPALCGVIGSSKARQYTAMGDTVNTASRLCGQARGGEILVGEATYEKVKDRVQAEALAPLLVKGKAEPLRVYRIRSVRS
jgi:adenylate cyclase